MKQCENECKAHKILTIKNQNKTVNLVILLKMHSLCSIVTKAITTTARGTNGCLGEGGAAVDVFA